MTGAIMAVLGSMVILQCRYAPAAARLFALIACVLFSIQIAWSIQ